MRGVAGQVHGHEGVLRVDVLAADLQRVLVAVAVLDVAVVQQPDDVVDRLGIVGPPEDVLEGGKPDERPRRVDVEGVVVTPVLLSARTLVPGAGSCVNIASAGPASTRLARPATSAAPAARVRRTDMAGQAVGTALR